MWGTGRPQLVRPRHGGFSGRMRRERESGEKWGFYQPFTGLGSGPHTFSPLGFPRT